MRFLFNNVESTDIKSYEAFRHINDNRVHDYIGQSVVNKMALVIDIGAQIDKNLDTFLGNMSRLSDKIKKYSPPF